MNYIQTNVVVVLCEIKGIYYIKLHFKKCISIVHLLVCVKTLEYDDHSCPSENAYSQYSAARWR